LVVGSRKKFPAGPQSRDPQHHKKTLNFFLLRVGASGSRTLHVGATTNPVLSPITLIERPLHAALLVQGGINCQRTIRSLHDKQINWRAAI